MSRASEGASKLMTAEAPAGMLMLQIRIWHFLLQSTLIGLLRSSGVMRVLSSDISSSR